MFEFSAFLAFVSFPLTRSFYGSWFNNKLSTLQLHQDYACFAFQRTEACQRRPRLESSKKGNGRFLPLTLTFTYGAAWSSPPPPRPSRPAACDSPGGACFLRTFGTGFCHSGRLAGRHAQIQYCQRVRLLLLRSPWLVLARPDAGVVSAEPQRVSEGEQVKSTNYPDKNKVFVPPPPANLVVVFFLLLLLLILIYEH
jgi:hypothetical protein